MDNALIIQADIENQHKRVVLAQREVRRCEESVRDARADLSLAEQRLAQAQATLESEQRLHAAAEAVRTRPELGRR